jgi:hypothetical protein
MHDDMHPHRVSKGSPLLAPLRRDALAQPMLSPRGHADELDTVEICLQCHSSLCRGLLPALAVANGFDFAPVPPALSSLNALERRMVAIVIPFVTIFFPRIQNASAHTRGHCSTFANDIPSWVRKLPRKPNECQIVYARVGGNRDAQQWHVDVEISAQRLRDALGYLIANHPSYAQIEVDDVILHDIEQGAYDHGTVLPDRSVHARCRFAR